jgi:hypothetical protein
MEFNKSQNASPNPNPINHNKTYNLQK